MKAYDYKKLALVVVFITTAFFSFATRYEVPIGVSVSGGGTFCDGETPSDIVANVTTDFCGFGGNQQTNWTINIYSNTINSNSGGSLVASCGGSVANCSYTPPASCPGDDGTLYYYAEVVWDTFSQSGCSAAEQGGGPLTSSTVTVTIDCSCSAPTCANCTNCIFISEFVVIPDQGDNGDPDATGEFIEIHNICDTDVDIGCYVICLTDESGGNRRGDCHTIPSGTVLASGDVYVIGGYTTNCSGGYTGCDFPGLALDYNWHADANTVWDVVNDQFFTSNTGNFIGVINDSGEDITLFDVCGQLVDAITYEGGAGVSSDNTENIGAISGCNAISITIPDSGSHTDLGSYSDGGNNHDVGFVRACDGTWTEVDAVDETPGVPIGACATQACITLSAQAVYYIKGENEDGANHITWFTEENTLNEIYVLEKSSDGEQFTPIHELNQNGSNKYTAFDYSPYSETYYRIKVIDNHRQTSYTDKIVISLDDENAFNINNIHPNPAKDKFSFDVSVRQKGHTVTYSIYNMLGELVDQASLSESQTINVNTETYEAGIYQLVFVTESEKKTYKIIVRR